MHPKKSVCAKLVALASLFALVLAACTPVEETAGGSCTGAEIALNESTATAGGFAKYNNASDHSGIQVSVVKDGSQSVAGSATTGSTGCYSISGLVEGQGYTVIAASQNSVEQMTSLAFISTPQATLAELGLTATGSISGTATIFGVPVSVVAFVPGTSGAGFSDTAGAFTIGGLPAGTYSVVLQGMGSDIQHVISGVSVTAGGLTSLSAAQTAISPGYQIFGDVLAIDFEAGPLQPIPFDEQRERYLSGGAVVLRRTDAEAGRLTEMDVMSLQAQQWGIAADVTVTEMWTEDSERLEPTAGVSGAFFSDSNTGFNPVVAALNLVPADDGLTLTARAVLKACWDWDCNSASWSDSVDVATLLALGTAYTLSVDCDLNIASGTYGQCDYTVNALTPQSLTHPAPGNLTATPTDRRRVAVGPQSRDCCGGGGDGDSGGGNDFRPQAHVKATVDNVYLSSDFGVTTSLHDAFDGPVIDATLWRQLEEVDRVANDHYEFDGRIYVPANCDPQAGCDVRDDVVDLDVRGLGDGIINYIQADVTTGVETDATSTAWTGRLAIVVGGALYNDGTGISGSAGNVYAMAGLVMNPNESNWSLVYEVWHCTDDICGSDGVDRTNIASGTWDTAIVPGSTDVYRLSLSWDPDAPSPAVVLSATANPDGTPNSYTSPVTVDLSSLPIVRPAVDGFMGVFGGAMDLNYTTAAEDIRISGTLDNVLAY